ncbi:MAG: cyclopropane-fatty-acyl-phospholipid synthase [Glaciecola sp.]|jgi:cyclopropane-fatty-acyl-phospholipid synthase
MSENQSDRGSTGPSVNLSPQIEARGFNITPTRTQTRAWQAVSKLFENLRHGQLTVVVPDGRRRSFGDPATETKSVLTIHSWDFFRRMLSGGSIGVGESYMAGEWEADDLVAMIRVVVANRKELKSITASTIISVLADKAMHASRANRIGQSQENIQAHYDLSNDLYKLFLDETLTYSAAKFPFPGASLEEAQRNKYAALAQKAQVTSDCHVLEIGCGWGGFAIYAAGEIGCKVTGITLSAEQLDLARERVTAAGLDHLVTLELIDYRLVTPPRGGFDRVVSIEMLEAVGHKFLGTYFAQVDRLLSPDGLASIQVITIPEQRYGNYLARPDFIQKHIFPGGHIPSLEAMAGAMGKNSELYIEHVENVGMDYAETLRQWRQNFMGNLDEVRALGFDDRFIRMWEFYFAYCEGAFLARYINDLQLVLTRTMNATLGTAPYEQATPLQLVPANERAA